MGNLINRCTQKERISQSPYEKAPILEPFFKTEHLETYSFIKKGTLPEVFYNIFYKVFITNTLEKVRM